MHILDKIVQHKIKEIELNKLQFPVSALEKSTYFNQAALSATEALTSSKNYGIIAEYKRKSPSVPVINLEANVENVVSEYTENGATMLSILTDNHFFGGSNTDLAMARKSSNLPILRKDFVIDEYQILEAKSLGADVILLIAEILTKAQVHNLASFAKSLGLSIIMELHSEIQLEKLSPHVDIVGVNNRNLDTFVTNIEFSETLFDKLPHDKIKISESGIHDAKAAKHLWNVGYRGFLIGEFLMKNKTPGYTLATLIADMNTLP